MFFLLPSYCRILIHIYFHNVLSEKKPNTILHNIYRRWFQTISIYMKTCCVFLNKWEVLTRFFGKSNIFKYVSTCQTRSHDFWIKNAICTFMYLFVVYFSFAPVISASIHRYMKYFVIQVLMMVTETETLTSTLHHNKFTYLDYIFSASHHTHTHTHTHIYIYIWKQNLALNNLQRLICHKNHPTNQPVQN